MNEAMLSLDKIKGWGLFDKDPGNPVVSSWISSDGHYGFIEFRTAHEANLGFDLQGMKLKGSELRIGRPKAYQDAAMDQLLPTNTAQPNAGAQGISNPLLGGCSAMTTSIPCIFEPTTVLRLSNLTTFALTARYQAFRELYTDVIDLCSQYGTILQIEIPRPLWVDGLQKINEEKDKADRDREEKDNAHHKRKKHKIIEPVDDVRNFELPPGFGSAFIRFESIEVAKRARNEINMREYDGRRVEAGFWGEELFENDVFNTIRVVKSEIREAGYVGIENLAIDFADKSKESMI